MIRFDVQQREGAAVVAVAGRLDMVAAPLWRDRPYPFLAALISSRMRGSSIVAGTV